jgi:HSP20 family molecular chaperone IbpA
MEETDHDYRIEVDVSGIKIEQIFMYPDGHSLSIAILPNHLVKSRRKPKLHEFDASHL